MKLNYSVIAGTCIAVYALLSMSTAEACSVDLYSQYDTIHLEYNGTIDGASTLDKENRALQKYIKTDTLPSILHLILQTNGSSTENMLNYSFNSEITHCGVQEVASRQFDGFDTLDTLNLSNNNISKLEEYAFCDLPVSEINLQDNALATLGTNAFYNLSFLVELRLSRNRLVSIADTALVITPQLLDIYLEDNYLTDLPYKSLKNTRLEHLFARNNRIEKINGDIADLSQLVKLDVRSNNVTKVSANLSLLHHLKNLLISDNRLTTLPAVLIDLFRSKLTFIDISGNPWHCGCDMKWLLSIVQSKTYGRTFRKTPMCADPVNVSMQQFNLTLLACDAVSSPTSPPPDLSSPTATLVSPSFNLAIPLTSTAAFLIVSAVVATGVWLRRNRLRRNLKHLKMISNDHYYRARNAWQDEADIDINAENEFESVTPRFDHKTFGGSLPLKHNLNGRLRLGRLLGRGEFGEVYEGFSAGEDGKWQKVAVKKLKDSASQTQKTVMETELNQLLDIGRHPNIIDLIGYGFIDDSLVIVMELAECGDLHAYLKSLESLHQRDIEGLDTSEHKSYLLAKHPQLFVFMWSVVKGMEYLSRLKIIHRDLAARNILLTTGPVAKLSDFGLSRDLYESGYYYISSKGRLPFKWMSPETLTNGKYTMKSDVWSFGVLLWELVTFGSTPFPGIPPDMLLNIHKSGYVMPQPTLCPDQFYDIMVKCWCYGPKDRPSFDILVENIDNFIQNRLDNKYLEIYAEEHEQLLDTEQQDVDTIH